LLNIKQRKFAAIEVGAVAAFIGFHLTLDIPSDTTEDEEKTIYTEYSALGVCGGKRSDFHFYGVVLTRY
jgi:hypothetical protein